jgi:methionine aminopeptidase
MKLFFLFIFFNEISFLKTPIENMLSHQVERFKIVGDKQIIQNPSDEQKTKTEKCTFETYEVYIIDILISTGEGFFNFWIIFYYWVRFCCFIKIIV